MSNLYNIQEKIAEFKLDVSDENIKRNTMKIVWMFPGVTFVDIKEKGILKVRGNFDQTEMGKILYYEIDESVDFINPTKKKEKNQIPGLATVYNYFNTPETQELVVVVFEFRVLDERIIPKAMEVIWEFPGVTSVEVENDFYLRVKGGEFNQLLMTMQLKDIDRHVKIIQHGQDVEAEPKKQSDVGSSKLQPGQDIGKKKMHGYAYGGVAAPQHDRFRKQQDINQAKQPVFYDDWLLENQKEPAYGVYAQAHGPFNQQHGIEQANQLPIYGDAQARGLMDRQNVKKILQPQQKGGYVAPNHGVKKRQPDQVVKKKNQEAGFFGNMFGFNKQQPQVNQEFGGKRENQNAVLFVPEKRIGPDGKYHIYKDAFGNILYPFAGSSNGPTSKKEGGTSLAGTTGSRGSTSSFKTTEFGSSSTRNRSSFSRSSSATDLSQSRLSSSMAHSSYSNPPTSSWDHSHSRSRSSENLSQSLSNNTGNPYESLKSNKASGYKGPAYF